MSYPELAEAKRHLSVCRRYCEQYRNLLFKEEEENKKLQAELAELQSKLAELTAPRRCELMDMGHEEGL